MSRLFIISIILISSIIVFISKHAVQSVLFLIMLFVQSAIMLLFIHIEFISLVRRVVYVGAIAILFRFVVIMLNLSGGDDVLYGKVNVIFITVVYIVWFYISYISIYIYGNDVVYVFYNWIDIIDIISNMKLLGYIRYSYGMVYVLSAGLILLISIIGSVGLTRQVRILALPKRQVVYQQTIRINDINK